MNRMPNFQPGLKFKSIRFSMTVELLSKDGERINIRCTTTQGRHYLDTWLLADIKQGFEVGHHTEITDTAAIDNYFDNCII